MLNIFAISYHNIWPLYEQPFTVFFHQGKFLINAPIGTGKSFLFFDGPLYGLYKYSERKLLNNCSTTGYIKVLFSLYDQYYLITRDLSPGKTKDSCSSSLYMVSVFSPEILSSYPTIAPNSDIEQILKNLKIQLEQISYKNEVDLNMGMMDLLPPREVFVNTMFLLQDSGNIFELTPANRLLVLKNVFGLLGVDEIKDKMGQVKRDIQTQKKIYSSTEEVDKKLKLLLWKLLEQVKNSAEYLLLTPYQEAIQDLKLVYESVNIEKFSLDQQFFSLYEQLFQYLQQEYSSYTTLKTRTENSEKEMSTTQQQLEGYHKELHLLQEKKCELDQQISGLDPKILEDLKAQKTEYIQQLEYFSNFPDKQKIIDFVSKHPDLFPDFTRRGDFGDFKSIVQMLIDQWKVLKLQQENLESRMQRKQDEQKNLEKMLAEFDIHCEGSKYALLYQQSIDTLIHQRESLLKDEKNALEQLDRELLRMQETTTILREKITHYQEILQQKLPFYQHYLSPEIFDEEIKKSSYVDIQAELELLQTEEENIKKTLGLEKIYQQQQERKQNIQKLTEEVEAIVKTPRRFLQDFFEQLDHDKQQIQEQYQVLEKYNQQKDIDQLSQFQSSLSTIKDFLSQIGWKNIIDQYEEYFTIQQSIKKVGVQIDTYQQQAQQIQEYCTQLATIQSQIQSLLNQESQTEKNLSQIREEYLIYQKEFLNIDLENIQQWQSLARDMDNTLHALQTLIDDFSNILVKVKKLQYEEWLAKNLYNALSKDLILFVLEDNLPILNDIINNFLAHIVDFQIDMKLEQKGNALELHTMIVDSVWEKETRSLSWGQKVILKLVWMLAVSVYSQSKLLFLDETINNLDLDAVGKVAELLQNFAQQNAIKMYVVTHSTEIKAMSIWDGVINLGEELGEL